MREKVQNEREEIQDRKEVRKDFKRLFLVKRLPAVMAYIFNFSTPNTEAGGLRGQPGLHNKFKVSLSCTVRPHLKEKKQEEVKGSI
jgi:hypothetical protein